MQEGLSKPLSQVVDRINLLGHTVAVCKREFSSLVSLHEFDASSFSFSDLRTALATVDVQTISPNYGEGGKDFGKFFRREILPRLNLKSGGPAPMELGSVAEGMENLSAHTILQLLAANPTAPRTASLRPQVKSGCNGCGKVTRRANHQKSVHPFAQKYSA